MFFGIEKDDSGTSTVASEGIISLPEEVSGQLFPKDFHEDDFLHISKRKKKRIYEDDPNFHDLK